MVVRRKGLLYILRIIESEFVTLHQNFSQIWRKNPRKIIVFSTLFCEESTYKLKNKQNLEKKWHFHGRWKGEWGHTHDVYSFFSRSLFSILPRRKVMQTKFGGEGRFLFSDNKNIEKEFFANYIEFYKVKSRAMTNYDTKTHCTTLPPLIFRENTICHLCFKCYLFLEFLAFFT